MGALLVGAGAAAFFGAQSRLRPTPDAWMLRSTNNPDRFFIWTTDGATYRHTFTYDPHAADDWLREYGGDPIMATNGPP
jgi:hypothetical protein